MIEIRNSEPKIAVVVVNYLNYDDTIECVESILNQSYQNFQVVVVDNGSPNESYEVLRNKYQHNGKVVVLRNQRNLGLAKGNNTGIRYAREHWGCDFIFVLNNDTILHRDVLLDIVRSDLSAVAVASPTVMISGISPHPVVNPPSTNFDNIRCHLLAAFPVLILRTILHIPGIRSLFMLYHRMKRHRNKDMLFYKPRRYTMQGSAFVLTPLFFKYYNQLYPRTFLYWEEFNLMWYLYKANLKSGMLHTAPVFHKVSQATLRAKKRSKFTFTHTIRMWRGFFQSLPLFFTDYDGIKKKYDH